ncbi:DNA methylase N-4/N-6 domain-containing protein [Calothrix sp. NIES-4071]|nr:DNA methylase N-4/N-6 domain-containing protein [Calothrix sp. NIES-4071]BAZ62644.1 DNA methylase N-4/N-6 domain-containing protein [Calothrix sp. NIES-4105]
MLNTSSLSSILDVIQNKQLSISNRLGTYEKSNSLHPIFIQSDALYALKQIPDDCFDVCMTSPPYWSHREYSGLGIGLEDTYDEYIDNLIKILLEVKRVLKPTGSLWLNIGDTYINKHLIGIPWRVALRLADECGFILRNSVIWNKVKGAPDNSKDKLRCVHEHLFHFVKSKNYYYNVDAIRNSSRSAKVENGKVISATGVSGIKYRRQIELSTALTEIEKHNAFTSLENILNDVKEGRLSDFRMIIRGQQRITHSGGEKVSGRARELKERGFYFLKYHPKGAKPGDVWDILPEDTQKREGHYAAYPEDLCKVPILASCPENGIVLDPFCGTGSTMKVAKALGRKSLGIDICQDYIEMAEKRCGL